MAGCAVPGVCSLKYLAKGSSPKFYGNHPTHFLELLARARTFTDQHLSFVNNFRGIFGASHSDKWPQLVTFLLRQLTLLI